MITSKYHSKKWFKVSETKLKFPNNELTRAGKMVASLLSKTGFQALWVGGVVRDSLLNKQSDNLDIATDATPIWIERILLRAKIPKKTVGKKFGTILAIIDKFPIEITTFRREARYSDRRHPDKVKFIKDYEEDAKRRDLTINALYFDPIQKKLFDPVKGISDLRLKIVRFVGDPKKRIDEDALRMLRAIRFSVQLGFKIEKNSFAAIKTRAKYIQHISGERVKVELDKILLSENRSQGLRLLDQTGLLRFIVPETEPLKKFFHKSSYYHLEGSMFEHTLLALKQARKADLNLIYALLFHDIGKPLVVKKIFKNGEWVISTRGHGEPSSEIFLKFAKKYKFPKASTTTIDWLIRNHMTQTLFKDMSATQQIEFASNPNFEMLMKHWECDAAACIRADNNDDHSKRYRQSKIVAKKLLNQIRVATPLVARLAKGDLIMKYSKLRPGKQLGEKIKDVKVQIVLGKIKNEVDLEKYIDT